MTRYILLILLFFQASFAQQKKRDSILKVLERHTKKDTLRVDLLNTLTKFNAAEDVSKNKAVLEEAVQLSKSLKYVQGLADSYTNLTSHYVQIGNYSEALKLALSTKKLQDSIKDVKGLIYTNSSIARIYNHLNKADQAIEIQLQNIKLLEKHPHDNVKAQVHFYLATAYSEKKQYNNSERHYKSAKSIAEKVGFKTGVAIANSSLGVLENLRGNYKLAIEYLSETLKFYETHSQEANIAHANLELAVSYNKLGQLNKAISCNLKAVDIYKKQNNLKNLSRAYFDQSKYYKKTKNYSKALTSLEAYNKVQDSIFSKEKVTIIEEMQTKYETEKNIAAKEKAEQEHAITKLENQKNRTLFLGALTIAALILIVSILYLRSLKAKKKAELIAVELKETQKRLIIEKQYRDAELKALKAQMNPHFIFNALNSIQDYIVLNQKQLASDYLAKFSNLIRNYLRFSDAGFISVAEEIINLKLYLELEKLRFEEKLNFNVEVHKSINSELVNIPTMLIQPYVENALKHGLLHKKDNRNLNIYLSKQGKNEIECIVEDNGIGREKSRAINKKREQVHKSFALKATEERLNLLNNDKENKIGVTIIDLIDNNKALGTKVIITIPIINK